MSVIIIIKVVSTAAATAMIAFVGQLTYNNSNSNNNNQYNISKSNNNNSSNNNKNNSNSNNNNSNSNNNNSNSNINVFAWLPSAKHIRLRLLGCPDSQMSSVFLVVKRSKIMFLI